MSHPIHTATLATTSLLDHLRALADCPRADGYACIQARHEHGVRSVAIDRPTLAIVLSGKKQLRRAGGVDVRLDEGDLFIVTRALHLDVTNSPNPESGLYRTLTVPFCDEVMDAARLLWAAPVVQGGDDIVAMQASRLESELLAWRQALASERYGEARLALASVLVKLCSWGHPGVLVPSPPSVAAQVRAIVAQQPAHRWQSRDFEAELGISGATLRRRLSGEQTSLSEALTDARLACAIQLLYTTRWPVKTVAARVGYRSASSFVRRFVERYGMEPGAIGNA